MLAASQNCSLVVVGFGIKFFSHLTTETKIYIEQADKVLYLVNDPVVKDWIQKNSQKSESLDELYQSQVSRYECYQAIADYVLANVKQGQNICFVLYGHPTVCAQPGIMAVEQAKKEGIDARILPGISAEDCLFADLLVNPGSCGCQSFEASDFIIYERPYSTASHLILWQIGFIGALGHLHHHDNSVGIDLLIEYLVQQYAPEQEAVLYEAAQYPHFKPRIDKITLQDVPRAKLSPITTLYIPPASNRQCNETALVKLGIKLKS